MSEPDASVAVVGGGIGGLTSAQELAERGFDVRVYEARDIIGGKSRTFETEAGGPGEHGFRFLPGFYKHLRDTMERIPTEDGGTVRDNLVQTTSMMRCTEGGENITSPPDTPRTPGEFVEAFENVFWRDAVPDEEHNYFLNRFLVLATSCDARWEFEHETTSWWDFTDADEMSEAYRKYLVRGATKVLVAMDPEKSSTRTVGKMTVQTLNDILNPSRDVEILNAPTNEAWIDPWVNHLRSLGVGFFTGAPVTDIEFEDGKVSSVTVDGEGEVEADRYVLATPVEVTERLAEDAPGDAESLHRIKNLETDWMNGVQFYLKEDLPLVRGHGIYFDSPWALTSISQRQFWDVDFDRYDGIEGILSVCVSDWNTPGVVYDRPAKECTREEVVEEVWTQLKRHLNKRGGPTVLDDDVLVDAHLDPAIGYDEEEGQATNSEPLLINTVGSRRHRPDASLPEVDNLYLAADYVKTNSDLATMEGADEAGRRAANAIARDEGVDAEPCEVYELEEPAVFEPLRRLDERRYRAGKPHIGETTKKFWKRTVPGTPL